MQTYEYSFDHSANDVYFNGVPIPSAVWGVADNREVDLERMYGDPSLAKSDERASFLTGGQRIDFVWLTKTPTDTPTISNLFPLTSQAAGCQNSPERSDAAGCSFVHHSASGEGLDPATGQWMEPAVDASTASEAEAVSSSTSQTAGETLSNDSPAFAGPIQRFPISNVVLPSSTMLGSLLREQCADFIGSCAIFVAPPTASEFGSTRGIDAIPLPISVNCRFLLPLHCRFLLPLRCRFLLPLRRRFWSPLRCQSMFLPPSQDRSPKCLP